MYDVITFGSATRDNFLRPKKKGYQILSEEESSGKRLFCFPLGDKIFIENMQVWTGGGGTNVAAALSKQGFRVAFCGKVGDDKRGEAVVEELKKFKVSVPLVKKDKNYPTALSIIISSSLGERTVLIYRGACHFVNINELPFKKLKQTKWFYLAPLSEESSLLFGPLVEFAKLHNIKVASNLGNSQIHLDKKILNPILSQLDVLTLNKEEASLLTNIPLEKEDEIIKRLASLVGGVVIITKGKEGSLACDGEYIFEAGVPPILPFEKTGAGDAFASGFLSGLLEKKSIEYSLQKGTANATSCIQKIGAKNGLLGKNQWGTWPKVKVKKRRIKY